MRRLLVCFVAMSILLCIFSAPANALLVNYTNRAQWDALFPGAIIENWDSFAAGTTFANGSTVNGITYNSSAGIAIVATGYLTTTAPNGLGRTPNDSFLINDTMTFSLATPIYAFAIDINTFSVINGAYQATTNMGELGLSFYDPFPGYQTGQFLGFTTDIAFTSVSITGGPFQDGYVFGLDTMRYQPVPEPATMLLLASGLVGLAGLRRKFKKA